ncbi:MAG: type II secretion system secretin GspD [Kiritimatiellaeota bacterium]|nr:type II secretion system secretin GspD [Kiritimatiellota bacterium]
MKKFWVFTFAAAFLGAAVYAQNTPAPAGVVQGVGSFTVMAAGATGATTTVVMLASNNAAPVIIPPAVKNPAPMAAPTPAGVTPSATAPRAPVPVTLAAPIAGPATPAAPASPIAGGSPFPIIPRMPTALPSGVSNALAANLAALAGIAPTNADSGVQLNFRDAPLDQLLNMYGDLTGRTVIKGPMLNAIITVRSQNALTVPEAIQALESVLALNGIALVPMGTKFAKVTKIELGRSESLAIRRGDKDKPPLESDQLVSYIFTLKYIEMEDVLAALQNVLHLYGKIQPLERANSVMLTDTSANIQRAQELLTFMDVPPEARVETKVYELENGDAYSIAAQIQSIVDDAQGKAAGRPRTAAPSPIPMITPQGAARPPTLSGEALEDGLIQGKVKILADDRTNMLIIIARPTNFPFFERLIKELDRKVEPEVIVRVVQLHWADADQIAGLLNDVLGSSGGTYGSRGGTSGGTTGGAFGTSTGAAGARTSGSSTTARRTSTTSRSSSSTSRNRTATSTAARSGAAGAAGGINPFGNNAPNVTTTTRVMADMRSNALLMLGTKEDIADLEKVIEKLDIMLSQVLIEVVILEVDLSKNTESGVTWLQRSLQAYNQTVAGPGGGAKINQPIAAFGGGFNPSSSSVTLPNGASIANGFALPGGSSGLPGGLSYFTTISGLNLDAVIHLVNNTSDARVLSTPVIMATDNETAEIKNTTQFPVITSSTILTTGGGTSSTYEYKDIGIDLLVKPHINPNRMVVLDITQTADTMQPNTVTIDGNAVPIINKRELQGLITVEDRTTIVLGGLIETTSSKTRASVPLLGNIPLIGWLFRSDNNQSKRTELLVLITPYVLKTPEEARSETKRLHEHSEMKEALTRGWSDSPLAKPDLELERALRKRTLFGKSLSPVAPADATVTNAAPATAK